jgi:hypothetical protein
MQPGFIALIPMLVIFGLLIASMIMTRRRGYNVGGRIIVRCLAGHVFTTVWVPGVSFKSIRFGFVRLQRCPVGNHVSLVTPVRASDLTPEERRMAELYEDTWIP